MRSGWGAALLVSAFICALATSPAGATAHAWTVTRIDSSGGLLTSVSCPSSRLCVAGDSTLHLISSTDPLGGQPAWHSFEGTGYPGNCCGYLGQPHAYTGVSCPSATLCVAVDDGGDIVVSHNPGGGRGAWRGSLVDCGECLMANSGALTSVACTPMACVGVDDYFGPYVSRDPSDLSSWNAAYSDWGGPHGASCDQAGLCVLFGRLGSVYTSTQLRPGRLAWQKTVIDPGNNLKGVSCPTLTLCVAVDAVGNALTSTDPTDAHPQWSAADIDGTVALQGVACPSASLCVAVDRQGDALSATAPSAGAQAWRRSRIDGTRWLTGISCPSSTFCLAVDRHGDAVTTTHPTGASLIGPSTRARASRRRP